MNNTLESSIIICWCTTSWIHYLIRISWYNISRWINWYGSSNHRNSWTTCRDSCSIHGSPELVITNNWHIS
ncbi:single tm domain protein [Entamoeba histolytica]|uniref:Single tm domain protein n=1 Tax=Entamoeba histolytica TaxID=5759 RepID=A0A175JQJ6_ENTHI|nr:single tm domain protein [Entamoeba histolytica]